MLLKAPTWPRHFLWTHLGTTEARSLEPAGSGSVRGKLPVCQPEATTG